MKKIYLVILLLSMCITMNAQEEEKASQATVDVTEQVSQPDINVVLSKAEADSAYYKEDYASAVAMYENLLSTGKESADVYYNLGNSYYKLKNIAKAILNYERALLLNPGDGDIRFNLKLANTKTVDKVTPVSEVFLMTWIRALTNLTTEKGWARLGIFSFILALVLIAVYFFAKRVMWKKVGFIAAVCLVVICVLANVFASTQKNKLIRHDGAIVMEPSVTVRSTPNESGTELFILHEGTKVEIKDNSMKEWKEIRLEDGNVGWVPTNTIEII